MYKKAKTQYTIQTIICVQVWHVQIWKKKNKCIDIILKPAFGANKIFNNCKKQNVPNIFPQITT